MVSGIFPQYVLMRWFILCSTMSYEQGYRITCPFCVICWIYEFTNLFNLSLRARFSNDLFDKVWIEVSLNNYVYITAMINLNHWNILSLIKVVHIYWISWKCVHGTNQYWAMINEGNCFLFNKTTRILWLGSNSRMPGIHRIWVRRDNHRA